MRERMRKELMKPENGIFDLKQDAGAMVDIEFLVQYLVLLNSYKYAGLLKWTDNVRLIPSDQRSFNLLAIHKPRELDTRP